MTRRVKIYDGQIDKLDNKRFEAKFEDGSPAKSVLFTFENEHTLIIDVCDGSCVAGTGHRCHNKMFKVTL